MSTPDTNPYSPDKKVMNMAIAYQLESYFTKDPADLNPTPGQVNTYAKSLNIPDLSEAEIRLRKNLNIDEGINCAFSEEGNARNTYVVTKAMVKSARIGTESPFSLLPNDVKLRFPAYAISITPEDVEDIDTVYGFTSNRVMGVDEKLYELNTTYFVSFSGRKFNSKT